MSDENAHQAIVEAIRGTKGVLRVKPLTDEEWGRVLEMEVKAEERVVLGALKSLNASLREALFRDFTLAAAVRAEEFPYDYHPTVKILWGSLVVGEEIEDPDDAAKLRAVRGNLFLWDRFVIYGSKVPKEPSARDCLRLVYIPKPLLGLPLPRKAKKAVIGCPSPEGHRLLKEILGMPTEEASDAIIGTFLMGFDLGKG